LAVVGMVAGAWAARRLKPVKEAVSDGADYRPKAAGAWVVIFLALVWMDSAAFYIIQHTAAWREATWGGVASLAGNSGMHLGAALLAGWLLDRGRSGRVVLTAFGLLASACVLLDVGGARLGWAALLYTAGVSFYSVALVYYPAAGGRPWLVALVFAVAGWIGSAQGIGMAQNLNRVPLLFVVLAGAAVAGALWVRKRELERGASGVLMLAVVLCAGLTPDASAQERVDAQVLRGREIYISEGCIHCHSQYVRPGTGDELLWGPSRPLAASLTEQPPLFGNRRQGPDLMNVGNRRSPEWNRLHLIAPRTVSPGSRMPSYASLFKDGGRRGEDLVGYLASLGADTLESRLKMTQAWLPASTTGNLAVGARLFSQLCSSCHGAEGRGDGSLAARLSLGPPDFSRGGWRVANPADLKLTVERIIKFGVPGTAMAGHEYLQDAEVVSLARIVENLHPALSP
jgi:cytochrome c oxidase cbb3-type subunit 2